MHRLLFVLAFLSLVSASTNALSSEYVLEMTSNIVGTAKVLVDISSSGNQMAPVITERREHRDNGQFVSAHCSTSFELRNALNVNLKLAHNNTVSLLPTAKLNLSNGRSYYVPEDTTSCVEQSLDHLTDLYVGGRSLYQTLPLKSLDGKNVILTLPLFGLGMKIPADLMVNGDSMELLATDINSSNYTDQGFSFHVTEVKGSSTSFLEYGKVKVTKCHRGIVNHHTDEFGCLAK